MVEWGLKALDAAARRLAHAPLAFEVERGAADRALGSEARRLAIAGSKEERRRVRDELATLARGLAREVVGRRDDVDGEPHGAAEEAEEDHTQRERTAGAVQLLAERAEHAEQPHDAGAEVEAEGEERGDEHRIDEAGRS